MICIRLDSIYCIFRRVASSEVVIFTPRLDVLPSYIIIQYSSPRGFCANGEKVQDQRCSTATQISFCLDRLSWYHARGQEIESIISSIPQVQDICVVGINDGRVSQCWRSRRLRNILQSTWKENIFTLGNSQARPMEKLYERNLAISFLSQRGQKLTHVRRLKCYASYNE